MMMYACFERCAIFAQVTEMHDNCLIYFCYKGQTFIAKIVLKFLGYLAMKAFKKLIYAQMQFFCMLFIAAR